MIELDLRPERKQLRVFGAVGSSVLAAAACWLWLGAGHDDFPFAPSTSRVLGDVCGVLAAYALVSTLAAPALLRPLYVVLSLIAFPIGFAASFVVLASVWYGLLFPIAVVFRVLGRDSLKRKIGSQASTYWVERPAVKDVKRYFRQF